MKLHVDVENGQKTGYFLDQKSNRVLLRHIAHGKRVLDCFSHTGGFALNAAFGNAKAVTAVDVSQTALDQGYRNAVLNHIEDRISFVKADVFKYLENSTGIKFLLGITKRKFYGIEISNSLDICNENSTEFNFLFG